MTKTRTTLVALGLLLSATSGLCAKAEAAGSPAQQYMIHVPGVQVTVSESAQAHGMHSVLYKLSMPQTFSQGVYGLWTGDRKAQADTLDNYRQNAGDQASTILYKSYVAGTWTIISRGGFGCVVEAGGYRGRTVYFVAVYNADPASCHDTLTDYRRVSAAVHKVVIGS